MEVQNSNITGYNDFEKFIGHSEFARVLELAQLLKEQKSRLDGDLPRFAPSTLNPQPVEEEEDAYPFDESASYIRSALIGKETSPIIKRGTCAITDSLIDETITTLASELRFVLNLKEQLTAARAVSFSEDREVDGGVDGVNNDGISNMESEKQASADEPMKRDITIEVQNKENANKFSKHQTDILINWMIENREEPYLSVADISYLTQATGLREVQVTNWVTNSRKRNMKAIIENEKKPYHFLDYLFLATDREKHAKQNASFDLEKVNGEEYPRPEDHPQKRYPDLSPSRSPLVGGSPAMFFREIFRQDYLKDDPLLAEAVAYEGSNSPFDENAADYAPNLFK